MIQTNYCNNKYQYVIKENAENKQMCNYYLTLLHIKSKAFQNLKKKKKDFEIKENCKI